MQKTALLALALSLTIFTPLPHADDDISKIELPDMGDSSGTLITPEEEQQLGAAFFRSLNSQITINQDPEIQQYIQSIGQKLVTVSDLPGYPFHFFVVLENDINAFAGPGGYVGINSGLILTTEAESELASVMAHEIAHVTQRHLYRAAEAAGRLSIPTAAAMLAAILLGTQAPQLGQAALIAIQAGSIQFQIDFTRENEKEADRVGMHILSESQFDPRSMPTFFERLQQSTRYYGQNIPEFLRTHPVTASRISDSRGRADQYPYKQYPDSLGYQLIRAKLRVLAGADPMETRKYFAARLNQGTDEQRTITAYGLGLTALTQQKFTEAEQIFQKLAADFPAQPQYGAALARTLLEQRQFGKALALYESLSSRFPENEAVKLEYITSLLKTGQAEKARKSLASLSASTQKLPVYHFLLAETYGKLQQPAESHRYFAEYYYAMGQTRDAITQIRLAQKVKGVNFYLSSILSDRLNFLMAEDKKAREAR